MCATASNRTEIADPAADKLAAERLARAIDYPYAIATASFVLERGLAKPFAAALTAGRIPVLAYGSNQAPAQLARKFGTAHTPIPVQRAELADHDVVYSAHLASYGAVPAALRHVPGTRVAIAVTWLTREQVERMHATELPHGNYAFAHFGGIELTLAEGGRLAGVYAYVNTRGHLDWRGEAVALAAVGASGRTLPTADQPEVLGHMRDRLAPAATLAAFVTGSVADAALRRARVAAMPSLPPAHWPATRLDPVL